MGFVEGVGGEGDHLVVDLVGHVLRHAVADAACDLDAAVLGSLAINEVFPLLLHDLVLLLGHGAAHQVTSAIGITSQVADDLHHLLLIHHAAVGHVQDGTELFGLVMHGGRVLLALDVAGDGIHGAGTIQGNGGDDVLKAGGLHAGEEAGHAGAFQLEHAVGITGGDHLIHGGVVQGDVLRLHVDALDTEHIQRVADHGQGAQAKEVHLEQAQALDGTHGVLGGDHLIVALQGNVFHHGLAGDQHTGGVGGGVAGHTLQGHGGIDEPLDLILLLVHAFQHGGELQRLLQGHAQVEGNGLGHRIRVLIAHAQHAANVAHHALGGHGAEGDDLAHMIRAILARHIVNDLLTALIAEVHVDIRHGDALRVEESLEQELVFQGIQHGDAQGIGHDGASAAATAGTHHDAVLLGVVDEIPHDEEVVHIAHAGDHVQLILQAGIGFVALLCIGVEPRHALVAQAGEHGQRRFTLRHRVLGQTGDAELELHIAAVGDLLGTVDGIGAGEEQGAHFLFALHIELGGLHAHTGVVVQGFAGLDAHQHFLGIGVLFLQVVAVVGGHQGNVHFTGQLDQFGQDKLFLPDAVIHDLDIEIPLPEDILHFPHIGAGGVPLVAQEELGQVAGQAGGKADQAFVVLPDEVIVDAGTVVIAGEEALGDEVHQVLIAGVVFAQEDQVAVFAVDGAFVPPVAAHIGLAADDGLQPCILHGGIEVDDAIHHAMVGNGAAVHAQRLHALNQPGNAARAVQQAVFRVQMQMRKAHGVLRSDNTSKYIIA